MPSVRLPEPAPKQLDRPRLLAALDAAASGRLTVVSAPAGWGKTTLLRAWVRRNPERSSPHRSGLTVWFSAGQARADNAWDRATAALAAALPDHAPPAYRIGQWRRWLEAPGPPVTVVLDGLHLVGKQFWQKLDDLVQQDLPRLRLVLGCRTDPPLRRGHGTPVYLRADQLAFTPDDNTRLLAAHGIRLGERSAATFDAAMRGWPVGVRLAAQRLMDHPDPDAAVAALVWPDQALTDYVVAEILNRLPPQVRDLALCLSVVDDLNPDVAGELSGTGDGHRALLMLHRHGLLPNDPGGPDNRPARLQLHPLVALVLHQYLRQHRPEQVSQLHRRAAASYAGDGRIADALRHALTAQDHQRAANLVTCHWPQLIDGPRLPIRPDLLPVPPARVPHDRRLALAYAAERLDGGDPVATSGYLRLVDRTEAGDGDALAPIAAAVRLASAHACGDAEQVLTTAAQLPMSGAGLHLPPGLDRVRVRALTLTSVGGARLNLGDLRGAERDLREAVTIARRHALPRPHLTALRHLAMLHIARGDLTAAIGGAGEAMAVAKRHGLDRTTDGAWAYVILAEANRQRNRIDAAESHLADVRCAPGGTEPALAVVQAVIYARIESLTGDPDQAATTLTGSRQLLGTGPHAARLRPIITLTEAELRLSRGEISPVRSLVPDEVVLTLAGWRAVVLGKLRVAERRFADATTTVRSYLEPGDFPLIHAIEANLIHARALHGLGLDRVATQALRRAMQLAEPEDIRSPFVEGGQPIHRLLTTALPATGPRHRFAQALAVQLAQSARRQALSQRENVIRHCLRNRMSVPETAEILHLSTNTVKTHVKSIYRKLGISRRDQGG